MFEFRISNVHISERTTARAWNFNNVRGGFGNHDGGGAWVVTVGRSHSVGRSNTVHRSVTRSSRCLFRVTFLRDVFLNDGFWTLFRTVFDSF